MRQNLSLIFRSDCRLIFQLIREVVKIGFIIIGLIFVAAFGPAPGYNQENTLIRFPKTGPVGRAI